jgi:hypothetical protein
MPNRFITDVSCYSSARHRRVKHSGLGGEIDAPGAIPLSICGGAPETLRREMYEASIENAPNNIDRGSAFRRRKTGKRRKVCMANIHFHPRLARAL